MDKQERTTLTLREKIEHAQQDIVNKIRKQDPATLKVVYREIYPMVEKYILENSGTKDDACDIFQDALYIFMGKIKSDDFLLTSKLSTFVFGIAKNMWLKRLTEKTVDANNYASELALNHDEDEEFNRLDRVKQLNLALNRLGEPCRSILIGFYYHKQNMKEIAAAFHYSSPDNAKNQKYKCLLRLKRLMGKIQDDEEK